MITRFFLRAFTSYPVRIKMGKKSEKEVNGGKKPNYELAKFFSGISLILSILNMLKIWTYKLYSNRIR